MNKHA